MSIILGQILFFLEDNASLIVVIGFFVVYLGFVIVYKVLRQGFLPIWRKWPSLIKDVESLVSDVKEIKTKVSSLLSIEGKMGDIDNKLDKLLHRPFIESKSPLSLTEKGRDLADKMDAERLTKKYKDKVDIKQDAAEYDIQAECFRFTGDDLVNHLSDSEESKLKKVAFGHGVTIDTLLSILGIVLRDAIFSEKNIPLDKIEKLNSNQNSP